MNAAYLLVSGLHGICGILAVHMAQHGAQHIIAMLRSGYGDAQSRAVVALCDSVGSRDYKAKGNVTLTADVDAAFTGAAPLPRWGVVEDAMLLTVSSIAHLFITTLSLSLTLLLISPLPSILS